MKLFQDRRALVAKRYAVVGIPAAKSARRGKGEVNNAELLYLFTEGSPARKQPPRPVLQPAIMAEGNREPIARELGLSTEAALRGDRAAANLHVRRAGLAGQNAARSWFTDPRNNWAPNAPSTIRAKGSDQPGINTGAMRGAIVFVTKEE